MHAHNPEYNRNYPSKLILFGEYTILTGSMSLSIPYPGYQLKLSQNQKNNFSGILKSFFDYLSELDLSSQDLIFQSTEYQNFLENGNFFATNIPVGYGLGSSGALTAAVFDRFFDGPGKTNLSDLSRLKSILAQIENHFHGKSSGIDPLISFLNRSLLTHPDGKAEIVELPEEFMCDVSAGLIDSGISRSTSTYVNIFREKFTSGDYRKRYIKPLTELTNDLIGQVLSPKKDRDLFEILFQISSIQYQAFSEMIPASIRPVWEYCLDSRKYACKLCGAGGGGFFYIFGRDSAQLDNKFPDLSYRPIQLG